MQSARRIVEINDFMIGFEIIERSWNFRDTETDEFIIWYKMINYRKFVKFASVGVDESMIWSEIIRSFWNFFVIIKIEITNEQLQSEINASLSFS